MAERTPSWISRSKIRRIPRGLARESLALLLLAVTAMYAPVVRAAPWSWYPWITFAGGYENDRIPDPNLDRFLVPGGGFLGVTPGFQLGNRLGNRALVQLAAQMAYERFNNDSNRSQLGGVATADLRVLVNRFWLWRTALAGNYYGDSVYQSANRFGGGIETGFGVARRGWSLEILGGIDGRRYENLQTVDDAGNLGTYTEAGWMLGLGGSVQAGTDLIFSGRLSRQGTDARDPLYDADFWLAQGSVRTRFALGSYLTFNALGQTRRFRSRPANEDNDSYWQLGVGLERSLTERLGLTARYAFARFTDPLGTSDDLQRLTIAVTWGLGRSTNPNPASSFLMPEGAVAAPLRHSDKRLFRCHAPDAKQVSVVGDFNGWDPAAAPMQFAGDGWWRIEIRVPAGSHQYAYLVDGKTVTPADAEVTIDDGFGGKNGLLQVESGGS